MVALEVCCFFAALAMNKNPDAMCQKGHTSAGLISQELLRYANTGGQMSKSVQDAIQFCSSISPEIGSEPKKVRFLDEFLSESDGGSHPSYRGRPLNRNQDSSTISPLSVEDPFPFIVAETDERTGRVNRNIPSTHTHSLTRRDSIDLRKEQLGMGGNAEWT